MVGAIHALQCVWCNTEERNAIYNCSMKPTANVENGAAPSFVKSDPAQPAFWNDRFAAEFTPWDQGGVPECLQQNINHIGAAATFAQPPRVLIPGCGSGYEVKCFADLGWDVLAIDFSPAAVAQAKNKLSLMNNGSALAASVHEVDFFGDALANKRFDIVYERAFLCALPRRMWLQWSQRIAALIPSGGRLMGFFFADKIDKGPPFGLADGELEALLTPNFSRLQLAIPGDSIAVFAGKETWQVWLRN